MTGSITRARKKSKDTLKQIKVRTQHSKICGTLGKRGIHSITCLPQEARKISNSLILHLKELDKKTKNIKIKKRPRVSKRKEIIKIRAKINGIESKRTIQNITNTRASSLKGYTKLTNL